MENGDEHIFSRRFAGIPSASFPNIKTVCEKGGKSGIEKEIDMHTYKTGDVEIGEAKKVRRTIPFVDLHLLAPNGPVGTVSWEGERKAAHPAHEREEVCIRLGSRG